jgi:hypothetical protein
MKRLWGTINFPVIKIILVTIGLITISNSAISQRKFTQLTLETGNAVTSMPFVGAPQLFYTSYHPYTSLGARLVCKEKKKHAWEQSVHVGYLYHRFVQHAIPLYSEIIYRQHIGKAFYLRAHLGLGYLHSIPATERFKLNDQGEYERIRNLGRAQGMVKFSISFAYALNPNYQLTLNYGVIGQMPFVKSYVPLLPYNTLQLGVIKSIHR